MNGKKLEALYFLPSLLLFSFFYEIENPFTNLLFLVEVNYILLDCYLYNKKKQIEPKSTGIKLEIGTQKLFRKPIQDFGLGLESYCFIIKYQNYLFIFIFSWIGTWSVNNWFHLS